MIYAIKTTKSFRKKYGKVSEQKKFKAKIDSVIFQLAHAIPLERRYFIHPLQGEYQDCFELHVRPNLLLIYRYEETTILLKAIGSHSELFD